MPPGSTTRWVIPESSSSGWLWIYLAEYHDRVTEFCALCASSAYLRKTPRSRFRHYQIVNSSWRKRIYLMRKRRLNENYSGIARSYSNVCEGAGKRYFLTYRCLACVDCRFSQVVLVQETCLCDNNAYHYLCCTLYRWTTLDYRCYCCTMMITDN